ncbi:UbiA family prenyltransferase [Schumannella soli]|uniref:1,4-dihydroxy-2-naphthoate prenyltransferase n=1 Tax=Schumannella soli TaxID=2590779 RepID=A0A506XXT3_9MICO|nr:UbiA family prenyltransferase [Schumannella soli]TPW74502.1 1,4-dihydroxy-2-naphthoate prenyltransferase [Schumannella soli]
MNRVVALLRSSHPGPTIVVTALGTGLAFAADAAPVAVALITAAVLANQLSIGIANDVVDAARDRAAGRRDKPIAAGVVSRRAALITALVLAAGSLALAATLSPVALVADALLLLGGWLYDLALKAAPASALCYLVGFAALPSIATGALAEPRIAGLGATVAAALLGLAAHLANVLPDLDDDRAAGVRGLPQRLGRRGCLIGCAVLLPATGVALALGAGGHPLALAAAAVAVLAAPAVVIVGRRSGRGAFRLVMGVALVLVLALVLAGGALL